MLYAGLLVGCNLFTPLGQAGADAGTDDMSPEDVADLPARDVEVDVGPDPDVIPENCGDGIVDDDEQCDRGEGNSNAPNEVCRTNCRSRRCSDGIVDDAFGEQCDDGNHRSHDGCSSTCLTEAPVWSQIEYPHAIRNHAAVYDPDRDVVVLFGGRSYDDDARSNETWEFDGTGWTKRTPVDSPSPRFDHRMVYDPVGQRVVLFGGNVGGVSDETWAWDGSEWTQINTPTTPPPRADHGLVWVPGQSRIVMYGGEAPADRHGDLWAFDGTDWSALTPMGSSPGPREEFVMVADGDTVWLHGGEVGTTTENDELWELDLTAGGGDGRWTLLDTGGTPPLGDHQGVVVPGTGELVVFGGGGDALYRWNGTTWQETPRARPWPHGRLSFAAVWDGQRDRMVVIGGQYGPGRPLADVWAFDLSGWALLSSEHPPVRDDARMVYDPLEQRVLLYGGDDPEGELFRDTWELSSARPAGRIDWDRLDTSGPQTETAALAYDESSESVVLFGGRIGTGAPFDQTWTFADGWSQQSPDVVPPARYWASMVFDTRRQRSILVSGCDDGPEGLEDAWAWKEGAWSELASFPVDVHCWGGAVYDPVRDRVVAYTRASDGTTPLTLEYDGTTWTQFPGESPPAREEPAMTYDASAQRVLMFGGRLSDGSGRSGEMWAFDGNSWELATTPAEQSPASRHSAAMVYDPVRRQTVVFGANTSSTNDHTTWMFRWENPATPEEVCDNGEDDDADTRADCDDPDCDFRPSCR